MKKVKLLIFTLSVVLFATELRAQTINTFAGIGTAGFSGDGGLANAAELDTAYGMCSDNSGNIYIADANNNRIRKVSPSGVITTFAGNGTSGYSGDGGAATTAELTLPTRVVADASGNIYINGSNRIRMVNTAGIISTIAGNGTAGFSGDGGPATAAKLNVTSGIAIDGSGNIFIADDANERIRMVNTSGIISTIAGNGTQGFSGDGGPATAAELFFPWGVSVDAMGNVYVVDNGNNRIRKINMTSGIITTIAGSGPSGGSQGAFSGDGGPATAAELYYPLGLAIDLAGNIYIADQGNARIRLVNTSGMISTIAGNGTLGFSGDGGPATAAQLFTPCGVGIDQMHNVYIADESNRIRVLNVSTGVNELSIGNYGINIYPNPNNGSFILALSGISRNASVEVYGIFGEKVFNQSLVAGNNTIEMSACANGVYTYRIISETGDPIGQGKLIIQK